MLDALVLLATTLATATAPTATLTDIQGPVLVSQGEAFVPVVENQPLATGDRVLLMEGATATLSHANGCVVTLEGATQYEVTPAADCATAQASDASTAPTASTSTGSTSTGLIVGAGVVLAAVAMSGGGGGDDDTPASP